MQRLAIADELNLFRKSVVTVVNTFEGFEVVIEAENGEDLLKKLEGRMVNIVLLDMHLPIMNCYETCKKLHDKYPDIKILAISELTTAERIHKIMECGAHGFFSKSGTPEMLETALRFLVEDVIILAEN